MSSNSWSAMASAPSNVNQGGALTTLSGDYIFGLRGGRKVDVWRYSSISGNAWTSLSGAPDKPDDGGALIALGSALYVLRGDGTVNFYRLQ